MQVVQDLQNVCMKVQMLGHMYSRCTKSMVWFCPTKMSGEKVIMLVLQDFKVKIISIRDINLVILTK